MLDGRNQGFGCPSFNSQIPTSIPVEILPWQEAPEKYGRGETKRIFIRD